MHMRGIALSGPVSSRSGSLDLGEGGIKPFLGLAPLFDSQHVVKVRGLADLDQGNHPHPVVRGAFESVKTFGLNDEIEILVHLALEIFDPGLPVQL